MINLDNYHLIRGHLKKGKVKKIRQITHPAIKKNGNLVPDHFFYYNGYFTKLFDDKGLCIKSLEYEMNLKNKNNWDWCYKTFQYDQNNNLLKYHKYNSDDNLIEMVKNFYNEKGKLIKSLKYQYNNNSSDDNIIEIEKNFYNENGKLIKSLKYRHDNKIEQKKIMKYDKYGNRFEFKYNSKNNLIDSCKYDEHGNEEFRFNYITTNGKNKIENKTVHSLEYDDNGKLIRDINISTDSNNEYIEKFCTSFDNYGREIEEKYYQYRKNYGFDLIYTWKFEYDKNGNLIKEIYGDVGLVEYFYKYDNQGNWFEQIKKKVLDDEKTNVITKRRITYFKENKIFLFKNLKYNFLKNAMKKCIFLLNNLENDLLDEWKMKYNFNKKLSALYHDLLPVDIIFKQIKDNLISALKKNKTKTKDLVNKNTENTLRVKLYTTIFCLCKINMLGKMLIDGNTRALDIIFEWSLRKLLENGEISEMERQKLRKAPTEKYSEKVFEIYNRLKSEFI